MADSVRITEKYDEDQKRSVNTGRELTRPQLARNVTRNGTENGAIGLVAMSLLLLSWRKDAWRKLVARRTRGPLNVHPPIYLIWRGKPIRSGYGW
jgi:hypothetical protein